MVLNFTPQIIALSERLTQRNLKMATAESCTGGGLSYLLTARPGSSQWFECGFITYSNTAKMRMLNVPATTLTKYGSVSAETAFAMAQGALQNSAADLSIAITGIAGPEGGSQEKPVGTIWLACAQKATLDSAVVQQHFNGDRETIRTLTIKAAIELVIQTVDPSFT